MSEVEQEFTKYCIRREAFPPIHFWGSELANEDDGNMNIRHKIRIFVTRGGKFVVSRMGSGDWCYSRAISASSAAEVVAYLRDGDGKYSDVVRWALNQAASENPDFAAAWDEYVE